MTIISSSLDKDILRQRLLDSLLKIFHMENCIFPLANENSELSDFNRTRQAGVFSERDKRIIEMITPYLSQALKNIDVFRRIQFEDSIFKMVDKDSSYGLIILNDRLELVHMNNRAKGFCRLLDEPDNGHWESSNGENQVLDSRFHGNNNSDAILVRCLWSASFQYHEGYVTKGWPAISQSLYFA